MCAHGALTPHSSNSACGTATAAPSFAAASPCFFAAARESLLLALSETGSPALPQALASATTTVAAAGKTTFTHIEADLPSRTTRNIVATSELALPCVESTTFYNATKWATLQQQEQKKGSCRHLEGQLQQLCAGKEVVKDRPLGTRRASSLAVFSSSWRGGERCRGRQNSISSVACSGVSREGGATDPKEGHAIQRGGGCSDGSDCSTRSCVTTGALPKKEAAESSSDETRLYRKYSSVGSTYSNRTTTREDVQYRRESLQGEKQYISAEKEIDHSSHTDIAEGFVGREFAAEICEATHARRSSRSKRPDGRDYSRKGQRGKKCVRRARQEESRDSNGKSCLQAKVQVGKVSTGAAASHILESYHAKESANISVHVDQYEDGSAEEEDVVPEDASIVAPGFLRIRCSSSRVVAADVAVPSAKPAFCATSAVSAVVVPEVAPLGHRGSAHEAAAIPPATISSTTVVTGASWVDAYAARGFSKNILPSVNKKGEAVVGEEVAAAIAATPPLFYISKGHTSSLLFPQDLVGIKKTTLGDGGVEIPKQPYTAVRCSAENQELWYGLRAGSLARGNSGDMCSMGVSGNTKNTVYEKQFGGEAGRGEGVVAAQREEELYKGMPAATARRGEGLTTASVVGGATGVRVAASTGTLQVGAAVSAADRTHRYYQRGDTSDVGRISSPTSARGANSNRGGRERLSASYVGAGEGAPRMKEGKRLAMPDSCVKGGVTEPEKATGARILCHNGDPALASEKQREPQFSDIKYRTPGPAAGGLSVNSRCGSASSLVNGAEMAAGFDRGRPGGLMMCPATGEGGKGGDIKTAAGCAGASRGNEARYNRIAVTASLPRTTTVMNKPTRVEAGRQRFLILDAPSDENLPAYIHEMKAFNVTHLVRTCEATYSDALVRESGICTHEWVFPDGEPPPEEVLDEWLTLCHNVASQQRAAAIAVHCVAGLGRAPVLVAVALIEKGMDPMDAIMFIRERRKGAINRRQLQFLKSYRRRSHVQRCCIKGCNIM